MSATLKTKCDGCGAKLRKNASGSNAVRANVQCTKCGATTILDPDKQWAEWQCRECGNCWNSTYPEQCDNCGAHAINQEFVRYVSIAEIEA